MLAYVGPETVSVVGSALAGIFGFVFIFWRWIRTQCKRIYRFVFRIKVDDPTDDDGPSELGQDAINREPQKLRETGS